MPWFSEPGESERKGTGRGWNRLITKFNATKNSKFFPWEVSMRSTMKTDACQKSCSVYQCIVFQMVNTLFLAQVFYERI